MQRPTQHKQPQSLIEDAMIAYRVRLSSEEPQSLEEIRENFNLFKDASSKNLTPERHRVFYEALGRKLLFSVFDIIHLLGEGLNDNGEHFSNLAKEVMEFFGDSTPPLVETKKVEPIAGSAAIPTLECVIKNLLSSNDARETFVKRKESIGASYGLDVYMVSKYYDCMITEVLDTYECDVDDFHLKVNHVYRRDAKGEYITLEFSRGDVVQSFLIQARIQIRGFGASKSLISVNDIYEMIVKLCKSQSNLSSNKNTLLSPDPSPVDTKKTISETDKLFSKPLRLDETIKGLLTSTDCLKALDQLKEPLKVCNGSDLFFIKDISLTENDDPAAHFWKSSRGHIYRQEDIEFEFNHRYAKELHYIVLIIYAKQNWRKILIRSTDAKTEEVITKAFEVIQDTCELVERETYVKKTELLRLTTETFGISKEELKENAKVLPSCLKIKKDSDAYLAIEKATKTFPKKSACISMGSEYIFLVERCFKCVYVTLVTGTKKVDAMSFYLMSLGELSNEDITKELRKSYPDLELEDPNQHS